MSFGSVLGAMMAQRVELQAKGTPVPDWYREAFNDAGGDRLRRAYEELAEIKFRQLDKLAAAFILETRLPPSECELVQKTEGLITRWYFQRRR